MKQLTIIYPAMRSDYSTLACITGAAEIFAVANMHIDLKGTITLPTIFLLP